MLHPSYNYFTTERICAPLCQQVQLDTVAAEVGADFVRIHQRYLVRTGAVDRMEGGEVVLRDGRRLPVSRSCQPSALLAFTRAELEG